MSNLDYYEPRFYDSESESANPIFFIEFEKSKTLEEYTNSHDRIVLLGNPGIGKSKELSNLFQILWDSKSATGRIPIGLNLKNFRKNNVFEDIILIDDWKNLNKIIFLLDGLDEIAEIQDFISAFSTFIAKYELLDIKYVISCRTNIYFKNLVSLPNFEKLFLKNLTHNQSVSILTNKYGLNLAADELKEIESFLETPFFIDLIADYYISQKCLPSNNSDIWEVIIDNSIEKHKTKKIREYIIEKPKLLNNVSKVALVNELMQSNQTSEEDLYSIVANDYSEFIEYPFIAESNTIPKEFKFIHRQYQEYFVAKFLSKKNFEEILSIIKLNDIEKIHTSFSNTTTFLLNLIPKDENFDKLIDWLVSNNPEILFRADSDRISDFRLKVFQDYFIKTCAETTIWIGQSANISISDIADFADHIENYKFLLNYITDSKVHFRVRISAMELIREFKHLNLDELLKSFFIILESEKEDLNIKSEVIRSIKAIGYHKTDQTIIPRIIELFESETDNSINNRILGIIDDSTQIDESINYILKEFDYAYKIKTRAIEENVLLGNDWKLKEILLKLNKPENFVSLATNLLLNNQRDFSEGYPERLTQRLKELMTLSPKIAMELIDRVITSSQDSLFDRRDFLSKLVIQLELQEEVFQHLFKKETFQDLKWFLSKISTEETIQYFIQNWEATLEGETTHLEGFRNILNHDHGFKLSGLLQNSLLQQKVEFNGLIPSPEIAEQKRKKEQVLAQKEFDEIFDQAKTIKSIAIFFKKINAERLTQEEVYKLERDFFDNPENYFKRLPKIIQLLHFFARKDDVQTIEIVKSRVYDLNNYIFFIDSEVSSIISDRNYLETQIFEPQKIIFQDWLKELSENIDFQNLIEYTSSNSFRFSSPESRHKYDVQQIIIKYYNKEDFKVSLSNDFLLNSIEYFDIENYAQNDHKFDLFLDSIDDIHSVKNRITENLSTQLFPSVYGRHAKYALKKGFTETFPLIETNLLKDDSIYSENELLLLFIRINGKGILKKMLENVRTRSCWTAIDLLLKLEPNSEEKNLCITKAKEYLDINEKDYKINALRVLVSMNDPFAIKFLCADLTENFLFIGSVNQNDYKNYNKILDKDLLFIKNLFNFIYKKDVQTDKFRFHYLSEFFYSYLYNLSKDDSYYPKLVIILIEIKDSLSKKDDHELFYINSIINNCSKSYIASKSIPMNFKEALAKVNELMS
ncbi:hypothetical protein D3C71_384250 [compost metagenome]